MSTVRSEIPKGVVPSTAKPPRQLKPKPALPRPTLALVVAVLLPVTVNAYGRAAFASPGQTAATAQEHADRGLKLAQTGDFRIAEAELRQAVDLSPDDPYYLADLGGILGLQQKLEEANPYFEKALRIDPGNTTIRRNLAANQWQLGRLQEAKANLNRILKAGPADEPTILLLGMVTENMKDYAQAVELLESVPALVEQRPESIAALARSYYHTDKKQKAQETLEKLRNTPGPQGVFLGGQVASEAGDYETAMRLFESIQQTYPDQPGLAYNIALVQYHSNHFGQSESTLLDLIGAGHQTSETFNLLAWSYYKQAKLDESIRAFDQAIDLEPTKEANYLDLGRALTERHLYAVASAVAKKAVERIPDSYRVYMMKGMIEHKQSYYSQAVASYTRAVELNPASPEANSNLAKVQALAGMTKEAEVTFDRGVKRFPRDALTYYEYALMLLRRGEAGDAAAETRAVSLLKTAISVDGSLPEPHYELGNLRLQEGKISEALQELGTAASLGPKDAKTHFALSRAYRHLGRSADASKEFTLYQSLKGEEDEAATTSFTESPKN